MSGTEPKPGPVPWFDLGCLFLCPDLLSKEPTGAASVKDDRRSPPPAARSVLEGCRDATARSRQARHHRNEHNGCYRGFRYPAEVIEHAVWLYHCFSLSLRDVETILAARGMVVSYESIRAWGLRFGRQFANTLKRRRPRPGDKWHLDAPCCTDRG